MCGPRCARQGRAWLCLVAACALLALNACRAAQEPALAPEALAPAASSFRLREAIGQEPLRQARPAGDVALENCNAAEPLVQTYTLPYEGEGDVALEESALGVDLAPLRGVMAAAAREAYQRAGAYPPTLAESVELQAPAGAQQTYSLVWEEIWDRNTLEVLQGDALVAEVPVRILLSAELRAEAQEATACAVIPSEGEHGRVALTLETGRPLELAQALECELPLAMTTAQQRVSRYVDLLYDGDLQGAYAVLSEGYQLRVPYPRYEAGYAPVREIGLCAIETLGEIGAAQETISATLRLVLDVGGVAEEQFWVAHYEVLRSGPIASVTMYKATLGEE